MDNILTLRLMIAVALFFLGCSWFFYLLLNRELDEQRDLTFEAVTVIKVVDGDTLKVRMADGMIEKVRLIGIEIENYVETEVINIVALNYETDIKGSFILGFGNMSTKKYYVAYKVLDDGGKQLIEMDAEDVIIYDSLGNDEQAYLEIDKNYYGRETAKRLYVPQNAIIENYELKIE